MKKIFKIFLGLIALVLLSGLTYFILGQQCGCNWDYERMKEKIETNYSGFHDKTKNRTDEYKKLTAELEKRTKNTTDFKVCSKLLQEYITFFEDKHIRVQSSDPAEFIELPQPPSFQKIDANFCLLKLPSFSIENKNGYRNVEEIDSIIVANKAVIASTPFLIIDLTGNTGGSDYAYTPILPYILTKSFYSDAVEFRASDDNIARIESILETPNLPKEVKKEQQSLLKTLKENRGSFVNPFGKSVIENKIDTIYPLPKRVGILIDTNNISSAEQFLLTAIQSDKVITFGTGNTGGALDYANLYVEFLPSAYYDKVFSKFVPKVYGRAFTIPTSRSLRLNRDNFDEHGYTPDVFIPKETKDKIGFIKTHLMDKPIFFNENK